MDFASVLELYEWFGLNQVLARLESDEATHALQAAAAASGRIWFGTTVWQGRAAVRLSVSSWRTRDEDIGEAVELLARLKAGRAGSRAHK